jgi:hypothetical protein
MVCSRLRYFFLALLFVSCPIVVMAAASVDGVRFAGSPTVTKMRIEVRSPGGTLLYETQWKQGNVLDWSLQDSFDHPLAYGDYQVRVLSTDLSGQTSEKETRLRVGASEVVLADRPTDSLTMTRTAHDGETGQLITTSGDLSFRFGDFLNRKDTEAMRLSAEGNLDVKGWIRPGQGIVFPDGSIATSAGSIMRVRTSRPPAESADAKLHPKSDVTGTGTTNQVTKWIDAGGTLADSAINEVGGAVRIGTIAAQGQLQIAGAANQDVFAGMGPNIVSGPAMNYGYAGLSFGRGAGFFNVRPDSLATAPNPSLRFMTRNVERMIITNLGDVGIGTTAPSQKLDVMGNVNVSGNLTLSGKFDQTSIDGLVSRGTYFSGAIPAEGAGTRLMWYPGKAAFRAGEVGGTQWDDANVGDHSIATGFNTIASGSESIAMGLNTTASGAGSTALGAGTSSSNDSSTAMGSGSSASGLASTAMGFSSSASGFASTAMGTFASATGDYSTAMGYYASTTTPGVGGAPRQGAFVYGDTSTSNVVGPTANDQFVVRAAGGTIFYSNAAMDKGVFLAANGASWASVSDRNRKEDFLPVDGEQILSRLAALPVTSWRYKNDQSGQRYIGPMAQDFHALFGLGTDTTIATLDVDGVTLAGIKALAAKTKALENDNATLRDQVERLIQRVEQLEAKRTASR